jgi:hypothetical protein
MRKAGLSADTLPDPNSGTTMLIPIPISTGQIDITQGFPTKYQNGVNEEHGKLIFRY